MLLIKMMKDPSIGYSAKAGTITAGSVTLASAAFTGATAGITCVVVVPVTGVGSSIAAENGFNCVWRKK
jgi:hypothetical protein